jgi:hypothetical protein
MSRGGWRGGGRPRKTDDEKRQSLHDFRLPGQWIRFLKTHKGKGSRMIEQALLAMFGEELQQWEQQDSEQSHEGDFAGARGSGVA